MLLFVLPAVAAIAIGGAAGAFAVEVLDEPRWSFPLYAILVGASLAVVADRERQPGQPDG